MEDIDLGYKFLKHKFRFIFSSKAKGIHYPHEKDNAMKLTSNTNNKYLFYENYKTIETELYRISKASPKNNNYTQFWNYAIIDTREGKTQTGKP
jgi:hypothetical protein